MKKNISFIPTGLYAVGIIVIFGLTDCKKSSPGHTGADNTFSFSYNGSQYSLTPGHDEYSVDSLTIGITSPDIFHGNIYFKKPDCAYYKPDATRINISDDCQLTNQAGGPIDSAVVYIYQSGSLNVTYKNCNTSEIIDLSGNHVTHQMCDMEGSFDLVLKNNENKLITISEGKFVKYRMTRLWKIH